MPSVSVQQALTLALSHHQASRIAEASAIYQDILAADPRNPDALHLLGMCHYHTGRHHQALDLISQAIALQPHTAVFHRNLALVLKAQGRFDESAQTYRRALDLEPADPGAWFALGDLLLERASFDEAINAYQRAIHLRPDLADAHHNLAMAYIGAGRIEDALTSLRAAGFYRKDFAQAFANAASLLRDQGLVHEALPLFRRAIEIDPSLVIPHSNFVYALHLAPFCDAKMIFDEHVKWAQVHAVPLAAHIRPHANDRDPARRLRIGYVSADFRDHAVARFILPILRAHDREQFEIHCICDVRDPDDITRQIALLADEFHITAHLSHDQLADLIRAKQIDILVDLSGHTARNRLIVFAQKPAPLQFTYLGYPGTTGLTTIDYRFTDLIADPPHSGLGTQDSGLNADALHTENLIRLPHGFLCYEPPRSLPDTTTLPALNSNYITFGAFNNFAKVTPRLMLSWGRILQAVEHSRLIIKSSVLIDPRTRAKVHDLLVRHSVPPDRVTILPPAPDQAAHLATYNQIDIALDTFPYNGTTTTLEALIMSVPVVTLAGDRHASRVGASILTRLDLPDLIATTPDQYEQIAITLAGDTDKLSHWRTTLRSRLQSSVLMNPTRITRDLESAYRTAWTT